MSDFLPGAHDHWEKALRSQYEIEDRLRRETMAIAELAGKYSISAETNPELAEVIIELDRILDLDMDLSRIRNTSHRPHDE